MTAQDNPFDILGVSPFATDGDIRRAWKRRISQVHPDIAGAGYDEMAAGVNAAYRQIATEQDRRSYRGNTTETVPGSEDVRIDCPVCGARGLNGDDYIVHSTRHRAERNANARTRPRAERASHAAGRTSPGSEDVRIDCPVCGARGLNGDDYIVHSTRHGATKRPSTRPHSQEQSASHTAKRTSTQSCQFCGRQPAASIHYSGVTGLILARRHWWADATLCRSCSLRTFRAYQSKLLLTGWWSLTSWIIAPLLLVANVGRMLVHAAKVHDFTRADTDIKKSLRGRPIWTRPGPIIVVSLAISVSALLFFMFAS